MRTRWATGIGRCGPFSANSSAGVPNRYLGTMWYPRRTLIAAVPAAVAASQAMSTPEFPAPTTSTRRPLNSALLR